MIRSGYLMKSSCQKMSDDRQMAYMSLMMSDARLQACMSQMSFFVVLLV